MEGQSLLNSLKNNLYNRGILLHYIVVQDNIVRSLQVGTCFKVFSDERKNISNRRVKRDNRMLNKFRNYFYYFICDLVFQCRSKENSHLPQSIFKFIIFGGNLLFSYNSQNVQTFYNNECFNNLLLTNHVKFSFYFLKALFYCLCQ